MSSEKQGSLRFQLLDVYGQPLQGKTDIVLRHQVLSDVRLVSAVNASAKITVKELYASPQGIYRVEVDPSAYMPVGNFVNIKPSGVTNIQMRFAIEPSRVSQVVFPNYDDLLPELRALLETSTQVLSFEGKSGAALYDGLDNIRKAGLLNIASKAMATPLSNGKVVFPYIEELLEVRGDRFFAKVPEELRKETKNSVAENLFHSVSDVLHQPEPNFVHAGSFKTFDHYGNLQLTFFHSADEYVADIDIDDAAGLEHLFQVLRNHLSGRPTHPYDIHEILVYYQQINPLYTFVV